MGTRWLVAAVLAAVLAMPLAGRAQSVGSQAEGKAFAAQATKDAEARRFEAAAAGFEKAYAAFPNPAYLYNIASVCVDGLQDPARGYPWAVRYLDAARDPAERAEAEALLRKADAVLARTLGKVDVVVEPAGADLYLDRAAPETRIARVAWVPPGVHHVVAEAPGYESAQLEVTVARGGRAEARLALDARLPVLRVESRTRDAAVFVDGKREGAPPVELRLRPGAHTMRAEAEGFVTLERQVLLAPGQTVLVRADLTQVTAGGTAPREVAPAKAPPGMSSRRVAAWALMGSGVALAVSGVVAYGVGYHDYRSMQGLDRDTQRSAIEAKWNKAKAGSDAAIALWSVGGAALVTGIVLYLVPESRRAAVSPLGPGGPGLTAVVAW